ncbi:flagellar basal body-associated FliL family protein [Comamonas guangdongensis]|uniref:Flagellar protein FliL n=1 Tax=Comamonas guangdongensis TaxID=510515 RepID=A0ABV3ZRK7_9BURK
MSANPNASPAPAKSKKLIVIVAIIAVLAIVAAGAYVWMMQQRQHSGADGEESASSHATVPTFLPLDNMVANLADPGGDRFVQLGITLELADEKTASTVKQYLPSIRSGILMLVSQRTADELLAREGKEKLATEDILTEVSAPLGYGASAKKRARDDDEEDDSPRTSRKSPVRRVLFSSFIIQ